MLSISNDDRLIPIPKITVNPYYRAKEYDVNTIVYNDTQQHLASENSERKALVFRPLIGTKSKEVQIK